MTFGIGSLGQTLGIQVGSFLGRQIVLGACRPDPEDFERRPFPGVVGALPAAVDLRPWMTPIEDQGALGSCTSNALAGAVEYLVRRSRGETIDVSRLFVYYHQRLWDGSVREDVGASVADGIRVLHRLGAPIERAWPYQRDLFAVQPPEAIYAAAERQQISDWWSLEVDADALRGCLARGFPVVFGTRVTESFMRPRSDGVIAMPSASDRDDARHGRHALLLVGYDDARRVFVVRNSWGDDWGDRGYCYMPYAYVCERRWTRSCWAIRATESTELEPEHAHASLDLRSIPRAPPGRGPSAAGGVASVLGVGAQVAIGALTGSGFLAGLAGGLAAGVTPGVAHALRGRDAGAIVDRDKSDTILARMRGGGAAPAHMGVLPWDDGRDEEAAGGPRAPLRPRAPSSASVASAPVAAGAAVGVIAAAGIAVVNVARSPVSTKSAEVAASPRAPMITAPSLPVIAVVLPAELESAHLREGGPAGALGRALFAPTPIADAGRTGSAVRFERGAIIAWDAPRGVSAEPFALLDRDPCFAAWLASGAARSPLGWPFGPIENVREALVRVLPCMRGAVIEHPLHCAQPVHGPIFAYWMGRGGPAGELGPPLAAPSSHADPREPTMQRFAHGTIGWSPSRGAWHELG